jgi:hypothetical protein
LLAEAIGNLGGKRMKLRKVSVVLLALLLAAMAIVPMVSAEPEQISSGNVSDRLVITPVFDDQEIRIKAPMDESEIVSFIFSEKWLSTKNQNKDSETITITIPESEIVDSELKTNGISDLKSVGALDPNERVVLLQIPKDTPEINNPDSHQMITLDYPRDYFSYFSDIEELSTEVDNRKAARDKGQNEQIVKNPNPTKLSQAKSSNSYNEWACYNTNWFQYPLALRGDMQPETLSNQGQLFSLYHEREIYLNRNGDTIELVLWYLDNGNIYLSAPLYDENQLVWGSSGVPSATWIDASSKNRFYYEVYIKTNGQYNVKFLNTGTSMWYEYTYNDSDNPSTYINGITGSSELTLPGSVTNSFLVSTNSMRDYGVKDTISGSWISPGSRFSWDQYKYDSTNNGLYVFMNSWTSGGYIYTYHEASNTDT